MGSLIVHRCDTKRSNLTRIGSNCILLKMSVWRNQVYASKCAFIHMCAMTFRSVVTANNRRRKRRRLVRLLCPRQKQLSLELHFPKWASLVNLMSLNLCFFLLIGRVCKFIYQWNWFTIILESSNWNTNIFSYKYIYAYLKQRTTIIAFVVFLM